MTGGVTNVIMRRGRFLPANRDAEKTRKKSDHKIQPRFMSAAMEWLQECVECGCETRRLEQRQKSLILTRKTPPADPPPAHHCPRTPAVTPAVKGSGDIRRDIGRDIERDIRRDIERDTRRDRV